MTAERKGSIEGVPDLELLRKGMNLNALVVHKF